MYTVKDNSIILSVYAQPGGKKSEVLGRHGDSLKIRLKAPPVEGKANDELIAFLVKSLNTSKMNIEIISGEISRQKKVKITNVSIDIIDQFISN